MFKKRNERFIFPLLAIFCIDEKDRSNKGKKVRLGQALKMQRNPIKKMSRSWSNVKANGQLWVYFWRPTRQWLRPSTKIFRLFFLLGPSPWCLAAGVLSLELAVERPSRTIRRRAITSATSAGFTTALDQRDVGLICRVSIATAALVRPSESVK